MGSQKLEVENRLKTGARQILDLLKGEYGVPQWQTHPDPISVLVQTILSQNTSDTNSGAAFMSLTASFGSWRDVADADVYVIERAIRGAGLWRLKAVRIKQALEEIERKRARLDLDFLRQLTLSEARDWLKQLPGVGLKTASCVLLFSLGMPALPVDTHILRVTKRLGLLNSKVSAEQAHHLLERLLPPEDVYPFHILIIQHGRKVCRARHPLCHNCILREVCYFIGGKFQG